uniref:Peptidase M16 N-terminal domain-containing protein n=1 Tax=Oryza glumipatula TaxID=40148 RepID=A0A0D9YFS5_9ORYZ
MRRLLKPRHVTLSVLQARARHSAVEKHKPDGDTNEFIVLKLDEIRGAKDPTCLASNLTPENYWRIARRAEEGAEAVEAESGERADMAAAAAAPAESNVEFIRARSDKREYRRVVLPNALECLLISDSETDKAAACMEVGVGSFSDPEGLEGLAHFLEHMLFYASEKYPGEQDYTKYITEHGGSCNAYTSSETTNFYFDVNVANFEEALDRFAQFFIKPLMSQDAVLREIKAVDSGSWETLETKPKERGLDIRQELLKFYENYSTNLMHLVVYGKESLDCIQSFVERLFSDIKNTDQGSFKCPSQPLSEEHMQLVIKAIPISEGDYLKISWPVTPNIHFYKEEHMEDIIGLVFKYILLLKENGIHEWIFDELVAINETEFHYQDKVHPISYVTDIVTTMRSFPQEEWLVGASLPSKYSPNRINMILDELSAERVRILWESKEFEGTTDSVEPWYCTAYSVENVTPSMIQQWIQKAPTEKLCIPKPNIFIPKDLSLKEAHEKVKFPAILRKTPLSRLWYKPDMLFSTPKVHIVIDFHCPLTSHSPEAVISTSLFVDLLADYLNAYAYDAQIAGLFYSIYRTSAGFQVSVGGYNDKMRILLDAIMKHISNFEVKPNRFCALKEVIYRKIFQTKPNLHDSSEIGRPRGGGEESRSESGGGEQAAMSAAAAASNVEFIRSRSDKRGYRRVVLPNALECLLISDSDTDKAPACMEVGVGSFNDPEGLEGLAHFLETTTFFFDVNAANFEEALDRFAQFFIKPLMSQDAVLREIKAVDSEHKKNLLSDGWRMYQLQKHLASKDHPYHKFNIGSCETLETKPKERGLDIRQELLKFYENYSANLMHLVVYGKESLDCIQSFVERMFSDIKNTDQRSFKCPRWAMNLSAGEGSDSAQYSFFSISMRLTDAGHEHMEDIIGLVFKYILLLKENGIHEWIYDELVAINETEFHYQDKVHPISYVTDIVTTMRSFPQEEWLVGASLPSKYSPNRINMILDELSAERVRILWESKEFEGTTDSVEPWYCTAYSVENVTPSMIQQWIQKAPTEKLCIPKPNIFIPKDLSLKEAHEKVKFPAILRKTPLSRLWYKPDMLFSTPKVHIVIDFHCPLTSHSPEAVISTSLFVDLLADYLNAYAYDAQIAGLFYSIYRTSAGFQVSVGGYNDKMRILLDAIMKHISNFEVKPNRFCALKETAVKDYQNFKFSQPYSQASYYISLILKDQKWPLAEKLEALSKLEPDSLAKFMPHLLSKTFLECYIHGNIEPNEATSIVQEIEDTIFNTPKSVFKSMSPSQYLIRRVITLENELKCYYQIEGLNQKNENSSVVQYIQVHLDDALSNIKLQLFALIARQPAANQLRTIEQLGYIADLYVRSDRGVRALEVVIQSTVKRYVKSLIDSKLEKSKNLWEESDFYWAEIEAGTLQFDRGRSEVSLLRELKKEEFIEFFDQYIRIGAPQRKTLSVQVFGGKHLAEFKKAIAEADAPKTYRITDIFGFKRSRPLYRSLKGGPGRITMD